MRNMKDKKKIYNYIRIICNRKKYNTKNKKKLMIKYYKCLFKENKG